jgi:hypothetical protein
LLVEALHTGTMMAGDAADVRATGVGAEMDGGWLGLQNHPEVRFCGEHSVEPNLGK